MHEPVVQYDGQWCIQRRDAVCVLDPLFRPDRSLPFSLHPTVVLDAGHGGMDSGAKGASLLEKDFTLEVAMAAASEISRMGITVCLTRTNDLSLSLRQRAEFATECNADVFVSIHANWAENKEAAGIETYLFPAQENSMGAHRSDSSPDAANMVLAFEVHRMILSETMASDRGIKRARYDVLKPKGYAAVLVECGFLSNSAEEAMLSDPSYRTKIAQGLAEGINAFFANAGKLP